MLGLENYRTNPPSAAVFAKGRFVTDAGQVAAPPEMRQGGAIARPDCVHWRRFVGLCEP